MIFKQSLFNKITQGHRKTTAKVRRKRNVSQLTPLSTQPPKNSNIEFPLKETIRAIAGNAIL